MRYYKVLNADGSTLYGGSFRYDLPHWVGPLDNGHWKPGKWMPKVADIALCKRGYHACKRNQLVEFLNYGPVIAVIEFRGKVISGDGKVVGECARITEILPWDESSARFFAVECAADVLANFERAFPNDSRVSDCLVVSWMIASGESIDENERSAARSAAEGAAWSAAESAAWSAAMSAQSDRLMFWLGEE